MNIMMKRIIQTGMCVARWFNVATAGALLMGCLLMGHWMGVILSAILVYVMMADFVNAF